MKINDLENERNIATRAAKILNERFIEAAFSGTVLYVENDALISKSPNSKPIFIKKLFGRNPDLSKKFPRTGEYKLKKRKIDVITK